MITVRLDTRIRLPAGLPKSFVRDLRAAFTHANPEFSKKRAIGFASYGVPSRIVTCTVNADGSITLPRGGTATLRKLAREHGIQIRWIDDREEQPAVAWPKPSVELRPYQAAALDACLLREQGIVRAPTGSGKTTIALAVAAALQQPALVIMRDSNLLDQWKDRAVRELGLHAREIGILRGGSKLQIGPRLTLALQQTLNSGAFPLGKVAREFGAVLVDEVHGVAAKTFQTVIDEFPARYRLGFSADETRKDGKEFLVYDQFGSVLYEVERDELERDGVIVPVRVRLVPTTFSADWYRDASSGERDFNRFLEESTNDEERNAQLVGLVRRLVSDGTRPIFVFTHRVEHARWIADVGLFAVGVRAGLMLGGKPNAVRFAEDKSRLARGDLDAAAGTYNAIGTGIDVPAVAAGVMATPIGNNAQFFNQVRGRICRPAPGKREGVLFVLWDRNVFPDAPAKFKKWNRGNVEILDDAGRWIAVR
jgi:superfamily II DNA or RNA helicase